MSTKNQTTSTNSYNAGSMGAFNNFTNQGQSALSDIVSNPYNNMFFNNQLSMGRQANATQQATAQQALMQRMGAMGMGGNSPLLMSQMGAINRQGSANNSNMYSNLLLNAANMRMGGIQSELNYHPLQTGQTQVQQQSGLGTWLPQVAGMAIGAATGNPMAMMGSMKNLGQGSSGGNSFMNMGGPSSFGGGFSNGGTPPSYNSPDMNFGMVAPPSLSFLSAGGSY